MYIHPHIALEIHRQKHAEAVAAADASRLAAVARSERPARRRLAARRWWTRPISPAAPARVHD